MAMLTAKVQMLLQARRDAGTVADLRPAAASCGGVSANVRDRVHHLDHR
jgi:hypothetical protein